MKRNNDYYDDLIHKGHSDVHRLYRSHFGHSLINDFDPISSKKGLVRWGDAETDRTLHGLATKEADLVSLLTKMPDNTPMYKEKEKKLRSLVSQRTELEKMLYSRADHKMYLQEKIIDD